MTNSAEGRLELRQYGTIVRRRWWIVAAVTLLTLVAAWIASPQVQGRYSASLRVLLSVPPEPRADGYFGYDTYYSWLSAEYLVDDFSEVIKSGRFAEHVGEELRNAGVSGISYDGAPATEKTHRVLVLRINGRDADQVLLAAEAIERVITKRAPEYFAQLSLGDARVVVIDAPTVTVEGGSASRQAFNLGLRATLGLVAGIGLTFLFHYLDTSLYESLEVQELLRLPVLGEIPAER